MFAALAVCAFSLAGCATTHYASPSAARPGEAPHHDPDHKQISGSAAPPLTLALFRNRAVTIRVLDNRMDRPQSAVLVDEVRAVVDRAFEQAHVAVGTEPPAVLELRILRYGAESQLSKWRACVGFGASVELGPTRRHELASERCAVTDNVWGTESADEALRAAFQEASRDLLTQLDGLPASP